MLEINDPQYKTGANRMDWKHIEASDMANGNVSNLDDSNKETKFQNIE